MLIDLDQLAESPLSHAEPANRPSRGWLGSKVEKIALSERTTLSQTLKAKIMSWLLQMIVTQQSGPPRKSLHKLSPTMRVLLPEAISWHFWSKSRLLRSAAFSFATRYMPVDNRVLRELLATLWRRSQHPFPGQLLEPARPGINTVAARQEFDNNRSEWW
ncbi:hypothetical protein V1515DRAFT_584519 [Lipomyces mesembrius]